MTDLERFIELYASFGVTLDPEVEEGGETTIMMRGYGISRDKITPDNPFLGYIGMCSSVVFDKDGKFIYQGFWEE